MNNDKSIITYESACKRIDAIVAGLTQLRSDMQAICLQFKELTDDYPDAIEVAISRAPHIPRDMWGRLLDVGRGCASPTLMFIESRSDYNRLRELPVSVQTEVLEEGVRVYEEGADGQIDHRLMRYDDLSPAEKSMVFDGPKLRTPEEQRQFLRQRARMRVIDAGEPEVVELPFEIKDGSLIVRKPFKMSMRQVLLSMSPSERRKVKSLFE